MILNGDCIPARSHSYYGTGEILQMRVNGASVLDVGDADVNWRNRLWYFRRRCQVVSIIRSGVP
jgi:hypothetical protein